MLKNLLLLISMAFLVTVPASYSQDATYGYRSQGKLLNKSYEGCMKIAKQAVSLVSEAKPQADDRTYYGWASGNNVSIQVSCLQIDQNRSVALIFTVYVGRGLSVGNKIFSKVYSFFEE